MNTITKNPQIGDAVVGNLTTNAVEFIEASTFDLSSLGDTYEVIGVVYHRDGKKVSILYKSNSSQRWSNRYYHKLTGYTLDGSEHTGVLSIKESSSVTTDYTITYTASDKQGLCDVLNAYFQDTAIFKSQDWYAEIIDDEIELHYNFTFYQQASNAGKSGFSLTGNLLPDVSANSNIRRKNGYYSGEGCISSLPRAIAYYTPDNSSTTYNPSSDVTSVERNYPICLPGYLGTSKYQSDHCSYLRSVYGEGEEGWLKFMKSCMPVKPCGYGSMGRKNGLEMTKLMAEKTYSHTSGTDVLCPAANYCYNIGTTTIPQGNWYLPTVEECSYLLDTIQYGTSSSKDSDVINATLNKMGGSAISNGSYMWSCCRCSTYIAWFAYGLYGFFSSGYVMYNSLLCVPVSLYTLA